MKQKKIWAAILAALMLLGMHPAASASSSGELRGQLKAMEEENKALEEKMDQLEQQISDNLDQMEELADQKWIIDQQVALLYQQIQNVNDQIRTYSLLIADKQDELDAAQARFTELSEKNKERIRAMEEEGTLSYWAVLFKASSFADLLDRLNMIQEIAAADRRRLQELDEAAAAVEQAQQSLETEKTALETMRESLQESQKKLEEKQTQAQELLNQLWTMGEEYEHFLEEAEAEQEILMQQIADKEAELKEAEYQEWLATYVPPTTAKPTTDSGDTEYEAPPVSSDGWVTPVTKYTLTSPFGMRNDPFTGERKMHSGVDMACPAMTPIYAARSGKVTAASNHWSMGEYVSINHGDGFASIYMHMTYYVVSEGQYVNAGQLIGYVGSSGRSTGNHLHFGISYNGSYVNPMQYVG